MSSHGDSRVLEDSGGCTIGKVFFELWSLKSVAKHCWLNWILCCDWYTAGSAQVTVLFRKVEEEHGHHPGHLVLLVLPTSLHLVPLLLELEQIDRFA